MAARRSNKHTLCDLCTEKADSSESVRIQSPVLPIPQAAAYIGVGARTMATLIAEGSIPSIRVARRRVVLLRADLDAYLQDKRREGRRP